MKKFQCYNDFELAIKQENIPNIDEEVMLNKIYSKLESKPKYNKFKIASIIICFILLTTGSITLAKNLYVYLFNNKGEKVLRVGKLSDEEKDRQGEVEHMSEEELKIMVDNKNIVKNVRENTNPNEQSLLLIVNEYEKSKITHGIQNNKYKSLEELKKINLNNYKLPIFPKGINVNDISVRYKVDYANSPFYNDSNYIDKLYKDCIDTNKEYIVVTQKLTNQINNIELYINFDNNYSRKGDYGQRILMNISNLKTTWLSDDFDEKNVEKIIIGDKEAIIRKNYRLNRVSYDIAYVDNHDNEDFIYSLQGFLESEKDLVIEILKSLQ